jgi:hypothetical protein
MKNTSKHLKTQIFTPPFYNKITLVSFKLKKDTLVEAPANSGRIGFRLLF